MYADRTADSRRSEISIKDRLGNNRTSIKDRLGSSRSSIKDRLGSCNLSRSVSGQDHHHHHQAVLKRQRQDDIKRDHDLSAETKHPIKRAVPENLRVTVLQDNIIPGISKNAVQGGLSKVNEKMLRTVKTQQPNGSPSCLSNVKGMSGAELVSAKKPAAQAAATPSIVGQKKQGVADEMTVASLLQSLGLSKYAIAFQAEEGPRKKILLSLASVKGRR
ncbi:uncharacterized protein LOC131237629 isoform X2 [Magnolia sinica]|uniref:uncharacterized protein LOC131237629 isoform X2 n=1 Tax=Magnolia sinica TaxID=86752 RepID=UPI0026585C60|nr:uncharacterized protein LOC131237629 isoform X2 [Magnolia sinica]